MDGPGLATERARLLGLPPAGTATAGGVGRLVRAADGGLRQRLPRPSDLELLGAWLGRVPGADHWSAVTSTLATRPAASAVLAAQELGLAVAWVVAPREAAEDDQARARHQPAPMQPFLLDGRPTATAPTRLVEDPADLAPLSPARSRPIAGARVVDLSSLWAAALSTPLLHDAGAEVIKVESTGRPDGARAGDPVFFDLLNAGKAQRRPRPARCRRRRRGQLQRLVDGADLAVEASRPRALDQLGIVRHRRWLTLTAYGATGPWRQYGGPASATMPPWPADSWRAPGLLPPSTGTPSPTPSPACTPRPLRWRSWRACRQPSTSRARGCQPRDGRRATGVAAGRAARTAPTRDRAGVGRRQRRAPRLRGISTAGAGMILHDVEVEGRPGQDVAIEGDRIVAVGPDLATGRPGSDIVEGHGGALLPGLYDHHLHLRSMAARSRSAWRPARGGRPRRANAALTVAAAALPVDQWIRGVGYDERVVGPWTGCVSTRSPPTTPSASSTGPATSGRPTHRGSVAWRGCPRRRTPMATSTTTTRPSVASTGQDPGVEAAALASAGARLNACSASPGSPTPPPTTTTTRPPGFVTRRA